MISGKTLTGREVVDQYPVTSLIGRQCVVIVSMLGNGFVDMQLGTIVDPAACVIDEPDGAILYVEYEQNDDYLLASVFEDTAIVLLSEPHLHEPDADSWYSFETSAPVAMPPVGTYCQVRKAGQLGDLFKDCQVVGHFFEKVGCVDLANGVMETLPLADFRPAGGPDHPDNHAVDRFAIAMKRKLAAARAKGRSGWNDKTRCNASILSKLLIEHIKKGNDGTYEDIANFAMMLHQREEPPHILQHVFQVILNAEASLHVKALGLGETVADLNEFCQRYGIGRVGDSVASSIKQHIRNNYQQLGVIHSEIADFAASIDSMMLDPECTPEVVAGRLMNAINSVIPSTSAAAWRDKGEPDPHPDLIQLTRAQLDMGDLTDDQMANAVYIYGNAVPSFADVAAGKAKMPISYLEAAKQRIRWLSRQLEAALSQLSKQKQAGTDGVVQ